MDAIADGMDAIEAVSSLTKYVPKIGTAISILQNTLKAAQVPFNNALDRVKSIDKKINPYKTPASTAKNAAVASMFIFYILTRTIINNKMPCLYGLWAIP